MFRTAFGDPRPATRDELQAALEERGMLASDSRAMIEFNAKGSDPADPDKEGYSAEIDYEGEMVTTRIWVSPSQLREDLRAVGICDIDQYD